MQKREESKPYFQETPYFVVGVVLRSRAQLEHVAYNFRALYHRCDDTSLLFPGHEYSETLLLEYFGGGQPTPGTAKPLLGAV